MGYVPYRRYEEVQGVLGPDGLKIKLPSDLEETWFFEHMWLNENMCATAKRVNNPADEGCILTINRQAIRWHRKRRLKGYLQVDIYAHGTVHVSFLGNLKTANLLRRASGREAGDNPDGFISFG